MALTQMQLIQSLGEAMAWFEREIAWGVPATELRHLCGRIGELYVAMTTNGQMAIGVNQRGYDVVSGIGERISVKTTARTGAGGVIRFNARSLGEVDRIVILRVNTEEMQIETILDKPLTDAVALMRAEADGERTISLAGLARPRKPSVHVATAAEVNFQGFRVRELENGSIEVWKEGAPVLPAKPALRELATMLHIGLLNGNGFPLNTRALGARVMQAVSELQRQDSGPDSELLPIPLIPS